MPYPRVDIIDLFQHVRSRDQVIPCEVGCDQLGGKVDAVVGFVLYALGEPVQVVRRDAQYPAEEGLSAGLVLYPENPLAGEKVVVIEEADNLKAFPHVRARQDESRGFAGGEKPTVGLTLPATKLGVDPVQVRIAAKEGLHRLRPDVGNQRQHQHDTPFESHLVRFHQPGVFRVVALPAGRRDVVDALEGTVPFKKEAEADFQHPVEPGQFPFQAEGVCCVCVHTRVTCYGVQRTVRSFSGYAPLYCL